MYQNQNIIKVFTNEKVIFATGILDKSIYSFDMSGYTIYIINNNITNAKQQKMISEIMNSQKTEVK